MRIILNGTPREVSEPTTVSSLLREMGVNPGLVAVEVNLQIIDRADFTTTSLKEGDKVEVIGFVGGGKF